VTCALRSCFRVKIAWRMAGTGPFQVTAHSPTRGRLDAESGPTEHAGSNWVTHEGGEWGDLLRLPVGGLLGSARVARRRRR